jgi:predicted HTH domain antitoxin
MTVMVQIEIPREVLHAARMTSAEIQRELAIHLFAEGKLAVPQKLLGTLPKGGFMTE